MRTINYSTAFSFKHQLFLLLVILFLYTSNIKGSATTAPFVLLKSLTLQHSESMPIGFTSNSDTSPHIFSIYTRTSVNPVSKREYLTSAKLTLSDPPPKLSSPAGFPPKYDLYNHLSETPAYTYLENQSVSITKLHQDIFILKIDVISSDCLSPLFFLDDNNKVDFVELTDDTVVLNVAEENSDNHNRLLDFLHDYRPFKKGSSVKLVNGFEGNRELYLKVFCFHWIKPVAPKIIMELMFDRKSHIDISLGKHFSLLLYSTNI